MTANVKETVTQANIHLEDTVHQSEIYNEMESALASYQVALTRARNKGWLTDEQTKAIFAEAALVQDHLTFASSGDVLSFDLTGKEEIPQPKLTTEHIVSRLENLFRNSTVE